MKKTDFNPPYPIWISLEIFRCVWKFLDLLDKKRISDEKFRLKTLDWIKLILDEANKLEVKKDIRQ